MMAEPYCLADSILPIGCCNFSSHELRIATGQMHKPGKTDISG